MASIAQIILIEGNISLLLFTPKHVSHRKEFIFSNVPFAATENLQKSSKISAKLSLFYFQIKEFQRL